MDTIGTNNRIKKWTRLHITHWTHDPIYNRDILLMERHLMRMYIIITHGVTEPQGWQRSIRLTARYNPFTGPYFFKACTAYSEQVGVYLHEAGVIGEIQYL